MTINKVNTVVVSCVAFETVKIVDPIEHIQPEIVHLLYWAKSQSEEKRKVYTDFIDEVKTQIHARIGIDPILHETKVYDFTSVLRELIPILRMEKKRGNNVFINLSAGPQTFAAAAMVASMMEQATPFFVGTKTFTVSEDHYYQNGIPIGISKEVYEPNPIPTFPLKCPPEDLVNALRIFIERRDKKWSTTYKSMIESLTPLGLMERKIENGSVKDQLQSDKMFYRRHYIDKWIKMGWVIDNEGALEVSSAGRMVTDVFCVDGDVTNICQE